MAAEANTPSGGGGSSGGTADPNVRVWKAQALGLQADLDAAYQDLATRNDGVVLCICVWVVCFCFFVFFSLFSLFLFFFFLVFFLLFGFGLYFSFVARSWFRGGLSGDPVERTTNLFCWMRNNNTA